MRNQTGADISTCIAEDLTANALRLDAKLNILRQDMLRRGPDQMLAYVLALSSSSSLEIRLIAGYQSERGTNVSDHLFFP